MGRRAKGAKGGRQAVSWQARALAALDADPTDEERVKDGGRVLDRMFDKRRLDVEDADIVTRHARTLAMVGFGAPVQEIIRRLRRRGLGSPELDVADAVVRLYIDPVTASARVHSLAVRDPGAAVLLALEAAMRCDVARAIDLARTHDGFVAAPGGADALTHVVLALVLSDRFAEAHDVLDRWRAAYPSAGPVLRVSLLRASALLAGYEHRHANEIDMLEEAVALCTEHALGEAGAYAELALAIALARAGEIGRARSLAGPLRETIRSFLDVYRAMAHVEIALIEDRPAAAYPIARRAAAFVDGGGYALWALPFRLAIALSAPPSGFAAARAAFGQLALRYQISYHLRRFRLMEELAARGARSLRGLSLAVRTRHGTVHEPFVRLWNPSAASMAADLYVDRVHGVLWLGGTGPTSLGEHPTLARALDVILSAPSFALPLSEFFEGVWQMRFSPIRHEGKCHVTLHRLRKLLAAIRPGAERLIELVSGEVRLAPGLDVRIAGLPHEPLRAVEPSLAERVVELCAAEGSLSPAVLEQRLSIARTTLHHLLRRLRAEGRVVRAGRGPATRYRLPSA